MEYKVLAFTPDVSEAEDDTKAAAEQLEKLINEQAKEGWKFTGVQHTEIVTQTTGGGAGCFSMMAPQPGHMITRVDMLMFEK